MDTGYPLYITDFPWLNTTIDAAVYKDGKLLLYHNNKGHASSIWTFHFVKLLLIVTFLFIQDFIYFFVGQQVYKYDYTQKQVVGTEKANT